MDLWINLFSIGKALKSGFNISNNSEILSLTKGNLPLTFDNIVRTKDGSVTAIKLTPVLNKVGLAVRQFGKNESIDVNNLHKSLDIVAKLAQD